MHGVSVLDRYPFLRVCLIPHWKQRYEHIIMVLLNHSQDSRCRPILWADGVLVHLAVESAHAMPNFQISCKKVNLLRDKKSVYRRMWKLLHATNPFAAREDCQ